MTALPHAPQRNPISWDAPLVVAWILLAHWRPQEAYPEWQPLAMSLLGAALVLRFVVIRPRPEMAAASTLIGAFLLALPLWSWLSTHLGVQPHAGTLVLGTLLQGALAGLWAALWVMSAPSPERHLRWGIVALGILALALAMQGFWDQAVVRPRQIALLEQEWQPGDRLNEALLHNLREGRMRSTLGDPNHLGLITAMGTVALIAATLWVRRRGLQIALALGTVVTFAALIATGSRGGWLSLLAGLGILGARLVATGRFGRRLLIVMTLASASGVVIVVTLALTSSPVWLERVGNITTVHERLGYWKIAWEVFLKSPLMGEGLGGFATWYPSLRPEGLGTARFTHNLPLQLLAETGLIGLLLALAPLVLLLRRPPRTDCPGSLSTSIALLALLTVAAVNSLVQHSILFRELWVDCLLLLGMGLGWWVIPAPARGQSGRVAWIPLVLTVLIAAVLIAPLDFRHSRARLLNQIADDSLRAGEMADVQQLSEDCVQVEPGYDLWHVMTAQRLMALADAFPERSARLRSRAEEHLLEAARLNPLRPSTWSTRASLEARRGDLAAALALQGEAIARHPAEPIHHREMALLLVEADRLDEALSEARRAAALKDDDLSWMVEGEILLQMRDLDGARACARAVIAAYDWLPGPWHLLSRIEQVAGNTVAAREAADEALRRHPGDAEIQGWRNRLGYD